MSKYYCFVCNYDAKQSSNYIKHLKTKKHNSCIEKLNAKDSGVGINKKYKCEYCDKMFTTNTSKYRHIRTVCKKSKDEDVKYIVELLNKKSFALKCNNAPILEEKIEKMNNEINKMMKKLQITNINHTSNTIIQNFHLNDYNNPDLSHLTSNHYEKALNENNLCVSEIIKMIYFNENKPENMNIFISSIKEE